MNNHCGYHDRVPDVPVKDKTMGDQTITIKYTSLVIVMRCLNENEFKCLAAESGGNTETLPIGEINLHL